MGSGPINELRPSRTAHLLIGPLPEAAHDEDDGDRRLQVGADGLDVDEKLPPLAGLDHWDPQHRHHHQHQHEDPVDEPSNPKFNKKKTM